MIRERSFDINELVNKPIAEDENKIIFKLGQLQMFLVSYYLLLCVIKICHTMISGRFFFLFICYRTLIKTLNLIKMFIPDQF